MNRILFSRTAAAVVLSGMLAGCGGAAPVDLTVTTYTSDATFAVNSHLIAGPREAILIDGQYFKADADKVAALVKASGKTLKAIVLTHAHPDHYLGLGALAAAFPGVPIQSLPEVVADFNAKAPAVFAAQQKALPAGALPDRLATVTALPAPTLQLDGETLEVRAFSDGEAEVSAVVYGPRQRLLFSGDHVYNRAYLWLAECKIDAWKQNLAKLREVGVFGSAQQSGAPSIDAVYPGHGAAPATKTALDEDLAYLNDVPGIFKAAAMASEAITQVKQKYPTFTGAGLLEYSTPLYFSNCKK